MQGKIKALESLVMCVITW